MCVKFSPDCLNPNSHSLYRTYTCLPHQIVWKYVFPHGHAYVNYLDITKQKRHVRKKTHNHLGKS